MAKLRKVVQVPGVSGNLHLCQIGNLSDGAEIMA